MPLPLAFPLGLLLGMSLAWLARGELTRSEVPLVLARPFLVAVGLGFVVYVPVIAYFVALHGDWAYLYLVRWSRVPSAVDLLLVLLSGAQIPLGFALATPWAMAKRGPALLKVFAAFGVVLVVLCAVFAKRLAVSATYAQYHAGFGAIPLGKTPLGRGVLLSWVALLAAYGWSAHALRSEASSSRG
jgi:hypothetical protein